MKISSIFFFLVPLLLIISAVLYLLNPNFGYLSVFAVFLAVLIFYYNILQSQPSLKVEISNPDPTALNLRILTAINTGSVAIPLDKVEVGVIECDPKGRRYMGQIYARINPHDRILKPHEKSHFISFQEPLLISYFQEKRNFGTFTIYGFVFDQEGNEYQSEKSFTLTVPEQSL